MNIDYSVRISNRAKHLQIKINNSGMVEVILPAGMSRKNIDIFIKENNVWIKKTKEKILKNQSPLDKKILPDSIIFPAKDEVWVVKYNINTDLYTSLSESNKLLIVQSANQAAARLTLQNWLSLKASAYLAPELDQLSNILGIEFKKICIRAQKTRWGSCSSRGTISLNRSLMFLDKKLIQYLMLHELCHIRFMNHSPKYWQLVESFQPKYKYYEKKLRYSESLIPFWARKI